MHCKNSTPGRRQWNKFIPQWLNFMVDFVDVVILFGSSIQEWTKQNFLKAAFHKSYLVHS